MSRVAIIVAPTYEMTECRADQRRRVDPPGRGYMAIMQLLLYLAAFVLLLLATFGVALPRVSFGWLGLAVWLFATALLPAAAAVA